MFYNFTGTRDDINRKKPCSLKGCIAVKGAVSEKRRWRQKSVYTTSSKFICKYDELHEKQRNSSMIKYPEKNVSSSLREIFVLVSTEMPLLVFTAVAI